MNSKAFVATLVAMAFMTGGLALAEMDGAANELAQPERQHYRQNEARQPDRRADQGRLNQGHVNQGRVNQGHVDRTDQDRGRRHGRWEERGAGPGQQFYRGGRLPAGYRHGNYVVDDWRGRGLGAPPNGCQWVQTGDNYVLVALATGIIVQVLLNN